MPPFSSRPCRTAFLSTVAAALLLSCGGEGGAADDAALPDVLTVDGAALDAAPLDSTVADAAPTDAAPADALVADAAPPDASYPPAADFGLTDLNPASPTYLQPRSVSGALGKVLLIHFPSFG